MAPENGKGCRSEALEREVEQLYGEQASVLFRYAVLLAGSEAAAQDAVHEAFLRYFRARVAGQQIPSPKCWLFRVLRNLILDQHRAMQNRREVGLESLSQTADGGPDPELLCWQGELSRSLAATLAPRELECFRLRAEGLRYAEIAEILGIRSGTVGALLTRAHQKLRTLGAGLGAGKTAESGLECAPQEPYAS